MTSRNIDERGVRRRDYLKASSGLTAFGTVGFAGCLDNGTDTDGPYGDADDGDESDDDAGEDSQATGLLTTHVTDQPGDIADFESCVVTIQGIWLKPRFDPVVPGDDEPDDDASDEDPEDGTDDDGAPDDGTDSEDGADDDETGDDEHEDATDSEDGTDAIDEQDEDDIDVGGGREYHEFDDPQDADLVTLQDGTTQLVDEREIETGEYEFLQLDVIEVDGTLGDGDEATVETPGNAPLQFKERFEIRANERTIFVADFTPVRRGRSGSYLLQPVARGTEVRYEPLDEADDSADSNDSEGSDDIVDSEGSADGEDDSDAEDTENTTGNEPDDEDEGDVNE